MFESGSSSSSNVSSCMHMQTHARTLSAQVVTPWQSYWIAVGSSVTFGSFTSWSSWDVVLCKKTKRKKKDRDLERDKNQHMHVGIHTTTMFCSYMCFDTNIDHCLALACNHFNDKMKVWTPVGVFYKFGSFQKTTGERSSCVHVLLLF